MLDYLETSKIEFIFLLPKKPYVSSPIPHVVPLLSLVVGNVVALLVIT